MIPFSNSDDPSDTGGAQRRFILEIRSPMEREKEKKVRFPMWYSSFYTDWCNTRKTSMCMEIRG